MAGLVSFEERGAVGLVRVDRPPVNAVDLDLAHSLTSVLAEKAASSLGALVLTGTSSVFSAGIDTKAIPTYSRAQQQEMVRAVNRMLLAIYGCPIPLVAAITGHAIGGGLMVALSADYRVCTTAPCKLALSEARAGVPFPAAPLAVLHAELDPAVARVLVLRALPIGPQEALAAGVVDELRPADEVIERACAVAAEMAGIGRESYARVKRQLRGRTIAELEALVASDGDPTLERWV